MKSSICNAILAILIIFETLFVFIFYKYGYTSQLANSFGLLISSLLFAFVLLYKFYGMTITVTAPDETSKKRIYSSRAIVFATLAIPALLTARIIHLLPINVLYSDIIPTIQILVKQFLNHSNPYSYTALAKLGYQTPSGYMPMYWLPCVLADLLHADYRWVSFIVWGIAFMSLTWRLSKWGKSWALATVTILLIGTYYIIFQCSNGIIGVTVEIMIAGYYMLFILGLNQNNAILQGTFITFCLLSRYTLMLWLPLWFFVLLIAGRQKQLLKSIVTVIVLVSVVYIIPFLSKDWSTFYSAYHNYEINSIGEWYRLNDNNLPVHLYNGVGMAFLFYQKYIHSDLRTGYDLLRNVLFISLIVVCIIMGIWYWLNRKNIDQRIFLLVSFKIYLTIFLALIVVPYQYLMITGNFVSIAIFSEQARYRLKKPKASSK